ncbi:MAG TPA: ATP-binding protein [Candidatus Dormibacteraeota bacterium]
MSATLTVAVLQAASSAGLVFIALLTVRDWLATRDRSRLYLVLAIGSLALVSSLGQVGKLIGPGFAVATGPVAIMLFLGSGLALLLFRDSVLPLRRVSRWLVIGVVAATGLLEIGMLFAGKSAPKSLQLAATWAFIAVWIGCVGEPTLRLWLAARGRSAVQRARMHALSYAYLSIVVILLGAVLTASLAKEPAVQIIFALAGVGIVPLLYAGFIPPAWLRRIWRQGEESRFQEAVHDIVQFSKEQATIARRGLEWAVRLAGAEQGFFVGLDGAILATVGIAADAVAPIQRRLTDAGDPAVLPLGGMPPRAAAIMPIRRSQARIVLISGPFTPVFGSDDQAWINQYAALVGTGLERAGLVEAVERANADLEDKVKEVTQRTREVEAANRELEAFSYTISHDLRAPLRAVNGFASILLEEYAEAMPEEARGYLKRVKDNGAQMGRLVDDLLAFSRMGRQALRKQPVTTRAVVDRALAQLAPALEGRTVEVVIGGLPDCEADPGLLEQVFVNLLSNAIKYSQKKPNARVEVGSLTDADDAVTYFVRDNGAGFDMAYADKLFGVFQRLHRSQDYEGTGVGLAIVHRIIERHGGRIWAKAKVDEGATFFFTLEGVQEWHQKAA